MPISLELSPGERELLLELLKSRIGELRQEIHHSRVSTFTDQLKQSQTLINGLLAKLESAAADQESKS